MDKYVEALEIEMATYLPIVKLATGNYLIGTRQRQVQLKANGQLMARIGGGYMYLDEYLKRYSRAECVKLNMLKQKEGTVKDAVVKILRNLKVDSKVIS